MQYCNNLARILVTLVCHNILLPSEIKFRFKSLLYESNWSILFLAHIKSNGIEKSLIISSIEQKII